MARPGRHRAGAGSGSDDPPAPTDDAGEAPPADEEHHGPLSFLRELPGLILVAFLLALLIKTFLVQAFFIPSQSMEHTLEVGDRVLVNKIVYRFREPRRGDVLVFENPGALQPDRNFAEDLVNWVTEGLGFSSDPQKDFIKRVVGLPGETIEVRRGRVFIDGKRIQEPYLHPERDIQDFAKTTIPPGRYFMMGDNRANSQDSRSFGPIARDRIVGRAFVILWPPGRFSWLSAG